MDKINESKFRTGRSLSWSEREAMIQEYLQGGWTKNAIWRKYTGQPKENSQIIKWMRHLGYLKDQPPRSKRNPQANYMPKRRRLSPEPAKAPTPWPQEAVEQIEALKKELKDAQLQVEAYQLIIDEAEKEFKIPIRKKSDTR